MIDEGYIKYKQHFTQVNALTQADIVTLTAYRSRLFEMGLIGAYADGIGFGNISVRADDGKFIISGTQTGHLPVLGPEDYTQVVRYSVDNNELWCEGQVKASSESLTHAAVYELSDEIDAVIHIHSKSLWDKHLGKMPTTQADVAYGTPQMAYEVKRLYQEYGGVGPHVIVMAGHEEGIITYGKDLSDAFKWIEQL